MVPSFPNSPNGSMSNHPQPLLNPLISPLITPTCLMHKQIRRSNKIKIKPLHNTTQCKKRWLNDSSILPHKTHKVDSSEGKQFRIKRLFLVGTLSRKSFQEKYITFKGALLFQIVFKTPFSSTLYTCSSNIK